MILSGSLKALINRLIQIGSDGKTIQYQISELSIVSDIYKELRKDTINKGKEDEQFIESDVELTSEQKVFISKSINSREWSVVDAENIYEILTLMK